MGGTGAAPSRNRSGVFPSPVTPGYRAAGYQKGWSSERVALPGSSARRHPIMSGKTLPSKWEDAEKWICSPVDGNGRSVVPAPHYRRPKSKSGPLGPVGGPGRPYLAASPMVPCFDSGRVGGFAAGSPFLAGVIAQDRSCSSAGGGGGGDGGRRSCSANTEPYLVRSTSVHGWLDAMVEFSPSLSSSHDNGQDEKLDYCGQSSIMVSPVVLKKDVATQMSPDRSTPSSPRERRLAPASPSIQPIEEMESSFSKMEVKDVQVDDRVDVTRWSKKHVAGGSDKHSTNIIKWRKKTVEAKTSTWEVAETTKRYKREEAKISAWEKMHSAKAEAAMRKLEMKLEKKRSSAMERILSKLRSAQREAQEMRSAASTSLPHEVSRTTKKLSCFRRTRQISSLSGCFTCHAF